MTNKKILGIISCISSSILLAVAMYAWVPIFFDLIADNYSKSEVAPAVLQMLFWLLIEIISVAGLVSGKNKFARDEYEEPDEAADNELTNSYCWECTKCGRVNQNYVDTCQNCGEAKPK
ncbi:MAG: hypothetical protein LUF33_01830 [Clostridiales bacterium]|nr:hypothetical protein [Clostridiales bacterium]